MLTLSQLKVLKAQPYQRPLKVKVVSMGPEQTYIKNGKERSLRHIGLADETACAKGKLHSNEIGIDEGNTYYLRNYILEKTKNICIILGENTKASKVPPSLEIQLSTDLETEARNLALEEERALVKTLAEVMRSPQKTAVTVKGQIIQDELPSTVTVKNKEVPVKRIVLDDNTATCQVTLWRDKSHSDVKSGDYVSISNTLVGFYNNENNLSTTNSSIIKTIEQPPRQVKVKLLSIESSAEDATSFLYEDPATAKCGSLKFPQQMVLHLFGTINEEEILTILPITVLVNEKNSTVLDIIEQTAEEGAAPKDITVKIVKQLEGVEQKDGAETSNAK